jgi:ureidoglycolate hydrolase
MPRTDPPGVDTAEHHEPGYKALLVSSGDWMAALMNGTDTSWQVPAEMEQHPYTDELFILLSGRALLVTAGSGPQPGRMCQLEMRPHVLYNVKVGTWHATPMTGDAQFAIVERTGTNGDGSVLAALTPEQQQAISLPVFP